MRTGGAKKRRDANEPSIVQALRKIGARVERISGPDLPDLLVGFRGQWYPLEVKTAKGGSTKRQCQAYVKYGTSELLYPVVRSVDEALALVLR
jgi:Holliday junction resolvase